MARRWGEQGSIEILLASPSPEPDLVVYVSGTVPNPGMYVLKPESRVGEAVTAAGGLLPEADSAQINLAARLVDGQHVHVPKVGEADLQRGPPSRTAAFSGTALVNVNTATAEVLEQLPSIGPSRAAAIIEYRKQYGPFSSPEDLLSVPGIGLGILDRIRDLVRTD